MTDVARLLASIPKQTRVVAVSKKQSEEKIRALHHSFGHLDFAENYVQEAVEKVENLKNLNLRWHFIGTLQRNKVKDVIGRFSLIHSVDSLPLLQKIDQLCSERGLEQKVLLQINIAEEASKSGFRRGEIENIKSEIETLKAVKIMGLMTMPPLSEDPEQNRPYFRAVRDLATALTKEIEPKFARFNELSMGTSGDYRVAIEEGATLVRLGTVLFGDRTP
jgi:PLP dependent protein